MDFYVYLWLREDDSPYYVGKGSGDRAFYRYGRRFKVPDPSRIRILPMPDEQTALAYERYIIDFYGRKDIGTGILRNLTDGGDAPPKGKVLGKRWKLSEKAVKNIAAAARGRKWSEESKARASVARKGKPLSPSHVEALRNATRPPVSAAARRALSQASMSLTPEARSARARKASESRWRKSNVGAN